MSNFIRLAEHINNGKQATFTGLVYTKVGKMRGRGANRKRYGDALVSEVIITGFNYLGKNGLVARSIRAAGKKDSFERQHFLGGVLEEVNADLAERDDYTMDNIHSWIEEQVQSWRNTLDGKQPEENHYEPLILNGVPVKGGKVYVGDGDGEKGAIYLAGLLISSKTLKEPPNGYPPKPNSASKTIVKAATRKLTPVGRYVTRRLTPGNMHTLRIGGTAARFMDEIGQEITDKALDLILTLED